jgi:hypothetical protein
MRREGMTNRRTLQELTDFVDHMTSYGIQLQVENSTEAKLARMTEMYEEKYSAWASSSGWW